MARGDRRARKAKYLAILTFLAERFPNCFALYEPHRRPLKLGIHKDIIAACGDGLDPRALKPALSIYSNNHHYISALMWGPGIRFDLDGNAAGSVTPDEREFAKEQLAAWRAKAAAREAAARNAAKAAKAAKYVAKRRAKIRLQIEAEESQRLTVSQPENAHLKS
jgi:sRNA-binding protein